MTSLAKMCGSSAVRCSMASATSRRGITCRSNLAASSIPTCVNLRQPQVLSAKMPPVGFVTRLTSSGCSMSRTHLMAPSCLTQAPSALLAHQSLQNHSPRTNLFYHEARRFFRRELKLQQMQQRAMVSRASGEGGSGSKEDSAGGGSRGNFTDDDEHAHREERGQEKSRTEEEDIPEDERLGAKGVMQLVGFALLLGLVGVCGYYIVVELLPSKMSPNTVMSNAHDIFLADPDTANHFGTPLKVYGRENHRHREGRRNFVEHVEYVDQNDGSKRTRVRFNVEGPNGHGMAYAEVSSKMKRGEWVYLCVQDMRTGHVITLHDNRAMLTAQATAGSQEEKEAFAAMLGKRS